MTTYRRPAPRILQRGRPAGRDIGTSEVPALKSLRRGGLVLQSLLARDTACP